MDKENKNVKPSYYITKNGDELFNVLEKILLNNIEYRGALKFNIYKYLFRYLSKNGVEDLEKALTYLNKLIEFEEGLNHE